MSEAFRAPNGQSKPMTLTVLGCGTLGTAILSGILSSLSETSTSPENSAATPTTDGSSQSCVPSRFIACVRRPESAKRIRNAVQDYGYDVQILQNENVKGVQEADVVILGCKPYMIADILRDNGMRDALRGKLLISICAGVPVEQIQESLYPAGESVFGGPTKGKYPCTIVRVMPNTAAVVRESMTVIATSEPPIAADLSSIVDWIFTRIGRVVHLPPSMMDVSTALCGSGPAFLALVMESLADGAVAMGLPRAEAQMMAAQAMRGTAGMVLNGEHPALVREKVSTPGGCTIGGLLVLEEGSVRGTVARSVREATVVAAQLGKGVSGVNGTRF